MGTIEERKLLVNEQATAEFAHSLSLQLRKGEIIYLNGKLGSGKTTFSRYLLQSLQVKERILSPTYGLVHSYELNNNQTLSYMHHFDLYRLADPEELEYLGIRDYFQPNAGVLIEWPEKGKGFLPAPTLELWLSHSNHSLPQQRDVLVRFHKD